MNSKFIQMKFRNFPGSSWQQVSGLLGCHRSHEVRGGTQWGCLGGAVSSECIWHVCTCLCVPVPGRGSQWGCLGDEAPIECIQHVCMFLCVPVPGKVLTLYSLFASMKECYALLTDYWDPHTTSFNTVTGSSEPLSWGAKACSAPPGCVVWQCHSRQLVLLPGTSVQNL